MVTPPTVGLKRVKGFLEVSKNAKAPTFVDVFAGCGGLSLGLMRAGWNGLFSIEKDSFAFNTLASNLLSFDGEYQFSWPDWLPKQPIGIMEAISKYRRHLIDLQGEVELLVGGPPCQGFSSAGRRDPEDPRNQLFASYIDFVKLLKPKIVLLENVRGITADFNPKNSKQEAVNYADKLVKALSKNYIVYSKMLDLSTFGVPQKRTRFFLIGIRRNGITDSEIQCDPFELIEANREPFLRSKGLMNRVSARDAISDLELRRNGKTECPDCANYESIKYAGPLTPYQKLMNQGCKGMPSNTRLAKHRPDIQHRFKEIIRACHASGRLNTSLSKESREAYGLKKMAIRVLDPKSPSPTITSMPDDLLHYSEPRTLTVRENARLQSFPDWFNFHGKYTTGGHLRRIQVPRFTQVANAVPPLVSEAIALSLLELLNID